MAESAIPDPSDTIVFGEKRTDSHHYHMDLIQYDGDILGNDVTEVEHGRHHLHDQLRRLADHRRLNPGSVADAGGDCSGRTGQPAPSRNKERRHGRDQ